MSGRKRGEASATKRRARNTSARKRSAKKAVGTKRRAERASAKKGSAKKGAGKKGSAKKGSAKKAAAKKAAAKKAASPRGAEAVKAALVDAAARLFAFEGDVSVRRIAAEAGVNHGLVHRHFGSKEGLRRAALEHLAARMDARLPAEGADLEALMAAAFDAVREDDLYWRILARSLLAGERPAALQRAFPVVRRLIARAEAEGLPEPATHVAERLAIGLGWLVFAPWIQAAVSTR
ncbi:MAG TPA: helix-turn-helix domain-containing protein [Polyangiaceae bacterium LLY-WYZ-15_(1-7)]|nr:helix-turn-helix domain-containing protein [Polyangiaceae bacterium LLY-WYZ-15_(1-7)]HJL25906.1 helix-turn-helix domain-containing protein [Polyangiaceae bacterium LLY-WYZ-15_(1-7)]